MSKLLLYGVFHANLNFSYIPQDLYPQIVHDCYWPLLKIAEERKTPLGMEFSGQTLELINSLDPAFVKRLRESWQEGVCEVVGSGFVQSIMPLQPARVNRENLARGNALYARLLGKQPTLAYTNEQVFSGGLASLYREAGYQALMVNFESAVGGQLDPEVRYRPCSVAAGDGKQLPIIWHSIAAYRDFQQYVERETDLDTYLASIRQHIPDGGDRSYPFYSSDWEVFDFKPWRVQPDGFPRESLGEMNRISELLGTLNEMPEVEFVSPSSVLSEFPSYTPIRVETSATPLTYKKQHQHSVSRWAVGGREGVRLNTQCHQLYESLKQAEWHLNGGHLPAGAQSEIDATWGELCSLWGSDFRTFTTEDKYIESRNRMGAALHRIQSLIEAVHLAEKKDGSLWLVNCSQQPADSDPISFTVIANGAGHQNGAMYQLQLESQTVPCQISNSVSVGAGVSRLTMEATPLMDSGRGGTAILENRTAPTNVNRNIRIDPVVHLIETDAVRLQLLPDKGGAIKSLQFPSIHPLPLLSSRLPTGKGLKGAAYCGDVTLEDSSRQIVTDHQPTEIQYPPADASHEIFVPIRCTVQTTLGTIWKTYRVYLGQPRIDLEIRCQWRDVVANYLRMGRMVLNAEAFDSTSLAYATVNGSNDAEEFSLFGREVRHDEPMDDDITARTCLGATEGWVALRDAEKGLAFITRPATLYSVPLIHFEETSDHPDSFLAMVNHSLAEKDETSHTLWRGHSTWHLSVLGGGVEIITEARRAAAIINGGLINQSRIDIT